MQTQTALSDPSIVPNPYPVYAELADREPVHWCEGLGAWAVLRYDDCRPGCGTIASARIA